jgi:porin
MNLAVRWTAFLTILATLASSAYSDDAPALDGPRTANAGYPEMLTADPPLGCDCCLSGSVFQQDPCAAKLTGDWGGRRSHLAENGITFDASLTQFYQGVTSGGREQLFHYTGHGEYLLNFDFEKLGMREGLMLQMRAEHRFGETVNAASGALLPPSILSDLPTTATEDLVLTEVLFTQFLSENIAVSFGKVNTFPQGLTPFTGGRGDDTFMNMSAMFPTVAITSVPYSTLGAGITIFKDKLPFLTFNVLNSNDTITQTGFDQLFEDGVSLLGTISLPTPLGEKPGVQTFGFSWNNREQIQIGQDPRVILPQFSTQTTNEAWSLFWQGFQYLQTYDDPQKGWGVFGAAGISDNNPTFLHYSLGFGIGGDVPLACRPNDRFGIAWFYNRLSNQLGPIASLLINPQDERGVELFYNIEVTPSFHITPDVQILKPALARGDAAILFAVRAKIDF